MQKAVGVVCLVGGVMLLVWAHNLSQTVGSQLKEAVTGSPMDKAVYFYIGGAALSILGVFRIFWQGK